MKLIKTVVEWQTLLASFPENKKLGFVPTMGNLHAGHLALFKKAVAENDITVVSIFVNPTQFNQEGDYQQYPRTLAEDILQAESTGVDFVFAPNYAEIYPDNYHFKISEAVLSAVLEGEFRPGHFAGMLTVVMKLLQIIKPTVAYFGEKDYQQLQLIKEMARAFFLSVRIEGCETVRLASGLPLSSRNNRLTQEQFVLANQFPKYFHADLPCDEIQRQLETAGFKVDYIREHNQRRFAAVWVGDIRLIDNIPAADDILVERSQC